MMNNATRTPQQQQPLIEMSAILRKHDPEATRLYDCIGQVKVFAYNSNELRWENSPNIEGTLCAYERQQIMNNKICPAYAFAIIHGDKCLIQPITSDMAQHADKLRLFYEVARQGRREVYCAHFITEPECLRLHTYLNRCIQIVRALVEQQQQQQQQLARPVVPPVPADPQPWLQAQSNGQATPTMPIQQTPTNIYRQQVQQQPIMLPNPMLATTPQFGPGRIQANRTPTRLTASAVLATQQAMNSYSTPIATDANTSNLMRSAASVPSPFINHAEVPKPLVEQTPFPSSPMSLTNGNNPNNNNSNDVEDPTSSLKRLLNIRCQTGMENLTLEDATMLPKPPPAPSQQASLDLMPPSAFEPIAATPPSPVVAIGAERVKHRLPNQMAPIMNREHFRHVLLHLVQNDEHFLDIIYQACLTYAPASQ